LASEIIRIILSGALVLSLFTAGWKIYRRLPDGNARASTGAARDRADTELTIVLRPRSPAGQSMLQLALYQLDMQAVQREFSNQPHSGKRFDDFLAQRLRGLSPVQAQLDADGRAIVNVTQGNWWIHAKLALPDEESAEWRLPVAVAGDKQTVELTTENAYERTKKF
jgi:hypothetical protein